MTWYETLKSSILSIHAPTRGATSLKCYIQIWKHSFNPRSYKRSDFLCLVFLCLINYFQSTLLQEERHQLTILEDNLFYFQSTLLQEERQYLIGELVFRILFQSTLLQEERLSVFQIIINCILFQSTLLQEERHNLKT